MDFYSRVDSSALHLSAWNWYRLPPLPASPIRAASASTMVISIPSSQAPFVVVAYTIFVTLIFGALLRIVHYLVLSLFPLRNSGNRTVMLVAFYNSTNFSTSAYLMFDYLWQALRHSTRDRKRAIDHPTARAAASLMGIALLMTGGDAVAKFLVGANSLVRGNYATVRPEAIFYPDFSDLDKQSQSDTFNNSSFQKLALLHTTAAETAAARWETVKKQLEGVVKFEYKVTNPGGYGGDPTKPEVKITYGYSLTGFDMGILNAPDFRYEVKGQCLTDYWQYWVKDKRMDMYKSFHNPDPDWSDGFDPVNEQFSGPFMNINPPNLEQGDDSRSFSITPHTAGRASLDENHHDPWYMTERNPRYNSTTEKGGEFRVARGRPALNCTQIDSYSHGGATVHNASGIPNLPKLKMSKFLSETVLFYEFDTAPIIKISNVMGPAALASNRFYFPNQHQFMPSKASMEKDFERLVGICYLASREVARNTVLLYPTIDQTGLTNLAEEAGGVPKKYADILLNSTDASALSVYTLVITPIICILLWSIVGLRLFYLSGRWNTDVDKALTRLNLRTAALQATQLYCFLDEKVSNGQGKKWSERLSMSPFIKDQKMDRPDEESGQVGHTMPVLVMVAGVGGGETDAAGGVGTGDSSSRVGDSEPKYTAIETVREEKERYMVQMSAPGAEPSDDGGMLLRTSTEPCQLDIAQILSDALG